MKQVQLVFTRKIGSVDGVFWNLHELPVTDEITREFFNIQPKTAYTIKTNSKSERCEYWITNFEIEELDLNKGFLKAIHMLVKPPYDLVFDHINGRSCKAPEFPIDEFFVKEDTGQMRVLVKR